MKNGINLKTTELETWDDFVRAIDQLRREYGQNTRILYPGQANHKWGLETTLERDLPHRDWSIQSYAGLSRGCVPEIESFTEKSWDFPEYLELESNIMEKSTSVPLYLPPKLYNLWVYLGHHGFNWL